jgi:glycosyltransferase involved in cell wall biosynthesis
MKILSIGNCELLPTLGSGKTRLRWSEGLRALGHKVDQLEPRDYKPLVGFPRGKRLRLALGANWEAARSLRQQHYDVVECFGGEMGWLTYQLSSVESRPLILAHTDGIELLAGHGGQLPPRCPPLNPARWIPWLYHHMDHAAFRYADRFITGSAQDYRYALETGLFAPGEAAVIEPGLDAEFLNQPFSPGDGLHIAYLGTWVERKNIGAVVQAVSAVLRQRPAARFHVLGCSCPAEVVWRSFPKDLRSHVEVRERMEAWQISEVLSRCGLFFLPSFYEGFGMATAEAMACGCAVVTTPTGFGAELEPDREALICAADDVAAMESALLRLMDDERLRMAIARAGWERVQTLDWERQVGKLESQLLRWLQEANGGGRHSAR